MQLVFNKPYLSIDQFSPIELPDFTVLTGINGSGKSQLLTAIKANHVTVYGINHTSIVHFNYENFKLDNEGAYNGQQISQEREQAWNLHQSHVKQPASTWRTSLGEEYGPLKRKCASEKRSLWNLTTDALNTYKQQIKNHFGNNNLKGNAQAQGIYSMAKKLPYALDEIDKESFLELYKPFTFKNDFLPNQLGKIFWDYYVKYRSNQIN